jgi:hypothetical protein
LEEKVISQLSGPPPGSHGLADEDELFELSFSATAFIENLNRETSDTSPKQTLTVTTNISWNTLFGLMGPAMIHEADQQSLRARFLSSIMSNRRNDVLKQFRDWLTPEIDSEEIAGWQEGRRKPRLKLRLESVAPSLTDFETVVLQLQALARTFQ